MNTIVKVGISAAVGAYFGPKVDKELLSKVWKGDDARTDDSADKYRAHVASALTTVAAYWAITKFA